MATVTKRSWMNTRSGKPVTRYVLGYADRSGKWRRKQFNPWGAAVGTHPDLPDGYGRTPLIAACRAIVRRRLGETVDVPDELGIGWKP